MHARWACRSPDRSAPPAPMHERSTTMQTHAHRKLKATGRYKARGSGYRLYVAIHDRIIASLIIRFDQRLVWSHVASICRRSRGGKCSTHAPRRHARPPLPGASCMHVMCVRTAYHTSAYASFLHLLCSCRSAVHVLYYQTGSFFYVSDSKLIVSS